jgi:osmotically-inducible protein OsmY
MADRRNDRFPDADADLSGPYARDTHRGAYGDDYARENAFGGTGARGDSYGSTRYGRGSSYLDSGPATYAGRGPKNYRRSDERITEDLVQRLTDDHDVDATDIEVSVSEGTVTLGGYVATRREKRIAEQIAEGCRGVKDVFNNLRVRDREIGIGKASE